MKRIPANTTYKDVKWISSNKNIATVSEKSVVQAKKAGVVTIRAKEPFTEENIKIKLKIKEAAYSSDRNLVEVQNNVYGSWRKD